MLLSISEYYHRRYHELFRKIRNEEEMIIFVSIQGSYFRTSYEKSHADILPCYMGQLCFVESDTNYKMTLCEVQQLKGTSQVLARGVEPSFQKINTNKQSFRIDKHNIKAFLIPCLKKS